MEILLTILGLYGVGSLMIIICLETKYREFMRGERKANGKSRDNERVD